MQFFCENESCQFHLPVPDQGSGIHALSSYGIVSVEQKFDWHCNPPIDFSNPNGAYALKVEQNIQIGGLYFETAPKMVACTPVPVTIGGVTTVKRYCIGCAQLIAQLQKPVKKEDFTKIVNVMDPAEMSGVLADNPGMLAGLLDKLSSKSGKFASGGYTGYKGLQEIPKPPEVNKIMMGKAEVFTVGAGGGKTLLGEAKDLSFELSKDDVATEKYLKEMEAMKGAQVSLGIDWSALDENKNSDSWEETFGDLPMKIASMTTNGEKMMVVLSHMFGSVFVDEGVWKISGSAQPIEDVHIESAYLLINQIDEWVETYGKPVEAKEHDAELIASVMEDGVGGIKFDSGEFAEALSHEAEKKAFKEMLAKEQKEMMAKMMDNEKEYFVHYATKDTKHLTEELKGGNQNKKMKMSFNLPGFKGKKK